ncbi:nitroreductase family protein [Ilyobacter polytropus]|uniref:Nitroreductase n=1 Tax=Ilyobacter polytropus (strain ATCC 51220 / DSM 2926 / LMG 16218 / CuHBu1) TaxID=572544 RepID=E3H8N2_ILYPC|nr:nitroreductase family protein [Ilyobacter polytropus]ADO83014.1 nitroreductase [Ilyobacter polytropus DSM 2926]
MIYDLIKNTRSIRSFGDKKITKEEIMEIMKCVRLSAASRNLQGIKYITVIQEESLKKVFPLTHWAGLLEWNPSESESPSAYILMCSDKNLPLPEKSLYCDIGIAAQNIMLKATEMGYGGCMIGAFDKNKVKEAMNIADDFQVELIIALGESAEKIKIIDAKNGKINYFRDENNVHYVPKRPLNELIIDEK